MNTPETNQGISTAQSFMDGPIPGQSLTKATGSSAYERPPTYTNEDDAMYAILNSLTNKKVGASVGLALERGIYASDLANTVLMGGVTEGKWTPDLAALLAKKTFGAIVATGQAQGITNMRYMKQEEDNSIDLIMKLPKLQEKDSKGVATIVNNASPIEEVPNPEKDNPMPIKGIMGE